MELEPPDGFEVYKWIDASDGAGDFQEQEWDGVLDTEMVDKYKAATREVAQCSQLTEKQIRRNKHLVAGRAKLWYKWMNGLLEDMSSDFRVGFKIEDGKLYLGLTEEFYKEDF